MKKNIFNDFINGNEDAFNMVYEKFFLEVKRLCISYTKDEYLAEDIASQAFMNVWNKRENIQNYRGLRKYLKVTAKNLCIDYYRKHHKENIEVVDPVVLESTFILPIEESADSKIKLQKLKDILDQESYEMIIYRYIHNLKHREIAERMNVTTAVVSNKLARALKKIKRNAKL